MFFSGHMFVAAIRSSRHRLKAATFSARRGIHLHSRTVDGPAGSDPLVLLHGLFGHSGNFNSLSRRLAVRRPVVLADLRNHGSSPWDDECSLEAMADDVIELLDTEGIDSATICGHSLGGKVAMAAALKAPERVSKLIVADIAPVDYDAQHAGWRANHIIMDSLVELPKETLASRAEADAALAKVVAEPGIRAFLLQNLLPDEQRFRFNLHALRDAARSSVFSGFPELPSAPVYLPVRVVAGSNSSYCNAPEHRAAIERFFPGAESETHFLNAGHWLHAEKPDDFFALVDEFCD